ncbi:MAG: DUF1926 domain-containing protein, partial [Treponema sp.]|nr:DUF1926 domain-containing protein [Treponema sp.]
SVLQICLELASDNSCLSNSLREDQYNSLYKSFVSYLYKHPKFLVSMSFSGAQIEFLEDKHPEMLEMLKELTSRNQVEIIGGGFYNPIFPLLFPVDRSGQIEKMNAKLRSTIGKRPRGMSVYGSIWETSLITPFQSCGMEYVHLDSTLIPSTAKGFFPIITSEHGKSIKVLPVYKNFLPEENESGEEWISRIKKIVYKDLGDGENSDFDPVVTISLPPEKYPELVKTKAFSHIEDAFSLADDTGNVNFTLPQQYIKNARKFIPAYIPSGMDWEIARWARKIYEKCENKTRFPITIRDFLNTYHQNDQLYERMMYVSMLISQSHGGDKMRKKAAQEKLWESQAGYNFVEMPSGVPALQNRQQSAYRILNEAEKLIRESHKTPESVTSYDYNSDGLNEYVCQMENFHAVISRVSGQICELDLFNSGSDYASSLSRIKKFDGFNDNYNRGILVEHLLDEKNMNSYMNSKPFESSVFSNVLFSEKKLELRKNTIQLTGNGSFSSLQVPVSLKKNYIISSNGFVVQYILKNETPLPLKGFFVVEANLAEIRYNTELVLNGNRTSVPEKESFNVEKGVSMLYIKDTENKNSFLFEPNEESGFCTNYIAFNRPDGQENISENAHTLTASLYWNIELAGQRAIEKTINFTIVPERKYR